MLVLVSIAALLEQLELGVVAFRLLAQPGDPLELERREVVAGQVADEVGGADDDRSVFVFLHRPPTSGLRAPAYPADVPSRVSSWRLG